jgi:hypothetical protein
VNRVEGENAGKVWMDSGGYAYDGSRFGKPARKEG